MNTEIIPAILEKNWEEVKKKIELVKGLSDYVQLDIMDGVFVPEADWNNPDDLKQYLEAEPSSVNFEVDLMISEPEKVVKKWIEAGAKRLIIHIESTSKMGEIIQIVRTHPNQPGADGQVEIGIALDIDTPNDILDEWTCNDCSSFARADFIQFMGIAKIGYQGQSFDEKVLEKISTLREKYPNAIISVDGAVDSETSPLLIKAGANRLAVGSAVFKNGDVGENIERLRLSAQGGRS